MQLLRSEHTSFVLGANDSAAATAYRPGEASIMENMRISPEGTAKIRNGSQRAHSSAFDECFGVTSFTATDGTVYWVAAFGAVMKQSTDYGVNWTDIATSLDENYWCFATMRMGGTNYLLAVNGGANGYKWDGTTWSTIANLPSGVKWFAVYNGRLWICGHSGSLVQASRILDFEEWSGSYAITLQVQTHDGDNEVLALFQVGTELLAFKRNSTNIIFGYGQQDITVATAASGLSRSVGCVAPRSIAAAGDMGCIWLSDRGLEFYQRGAGIRLISQSVRTFFETSISWGDFVATGNPMVPSACFVPNPGRHEYLLALPTGEGLCSTILRLHLSLPTPEGGFAASMDPYAVTGAVGGTLYVDGGGSLSFSLAPDRSKGELSGGSLSLSPDSDGSYLEIDSGGSLTLMSAGFGFSAMFATDRFGTENAQPNTGCTDGYLRWLDIGTLDDVLSDDSGGSEYTGRLRGPPELFGAPFNRKTARKVEAMVTSPTAATVILALIAGENEVDTKSVSVTSSVSAPVRAGAKMFGRDETLWSEIRSTTAELEVASLSMWAAVERSRF